MCNAPSYYYRPASAGICISNKNVVFLINVVLIGQIVCSTNMFVAIKLVMECCILLGVVSVYMNSVPMVVQFLTAKHFLLSTLAVNIRDSIIVCIEYFVAPLL